MTRLQLRTALATGILLGACTGSAGSDAVGGSSEALTKAKAEAVDTSLVEAATPVAKITPIDSVIIGRRPRLPTEVVPVDPNPATPPPAAPACSQTALWISPSDRDVGCPEAGALETGAWKPRRVYPKPTDPNNPNANLPDDVPKALRNICAYDWSPRTNEPPDLEGLKRRLGGQPPEYDCRVTTSLAPVDWHESERWKSMRDTAYQQMGMGRGEPTFNSTTLVAVVDSAAIPFEDLNETDKFGHGRLVGRLVEDATSFADGRSRATRIVNSAALISNFDGSVNEHNGGFVGTRAQLGRAIFKATREYLDHLERLDRDKAARGVITLALGWEGIHGGNGESPNQLSPASYTVYAALARAACLGMVSVAAAGNKHTNADTEPTFPAAWQNMRAPSQRECDEQFLVGDRDKLVREHGLETSIDDRGFPLVVAASAVDERDQPLYSTRDNAAARSVAYGLAMVTHDYGGARGDHTSTLTGSSFAAAVMAAALAGVWAVEPRLPPHKAVEYVYESSEPLGTMSTMRFAGSNQEQRRVSVCAAIQNTACWNGGCDPNFGCDTVRAGSGRALWTAELFERPGDPSLSSALGAATALPSAYAQPWVGGQPGSEGCGGLCSVARNRFVTISTPTLATSNLRIVTGGTSYVISPPSPGASYPATFTTTLPASAVIDKPVLQTEVSGTVVKAEALPVVD